MLPVMITAYAIMILAISISPLYLGVSSAEIQNRDKEMSQRMSSSEHLNSGLMMGLQDYTWVDSTLKFLQS